MVLNNGIIIQKGIVGSLGIGGTVSATFPIAMSNTTYLVAYGCGTAQNVDDMTYYTSLSNTGCSFYRSNNGNGSSSSKCSVKYIVFGY